MIDNGFGDPILDAAAGIEKLALAEDRDGSAISDSVEPHQWSIADLIEDRASAHRVIMGAGSDAVQVVDAIRLCRWFLL